MARKLTKEQQEWYSLEQAEKAFRKEKVPFDEEKLEKVKKEKKPKKDNGLGKRGKK